MYIEILSNIATKHQHQQFWALLHQPSSETSLILYMCKSREKFSLHNVFQGSLKTRTTDILFFHISYNISNNWTWFLQMLFYGSNLLLFHISSCWFMIVLTDNRNDKCPHWGLNSRPSVYKTDALPLSYRGIILLITEITIHNLVEIIINMCTSSNGFHAWWWWYNYHFIVPINL